MTCSTASCSSTAIADRADGATHETQPDVHEARSALQYGGGGGVTVRENHPQHDAPAVVAGTEGRGGSSGS